MPKPFNPHAMTEYIHYRQVADEMECVLKAIAALRGETTAAARAHKRLARLTNSQRAGQAALLSAARVPMCADADEVRDLLTRQVMRYVLRTGSVPTKDDVKRYRELAREARGGVHTNVELPAAVAA